MAGKNNTVAATVNKMSLEKLKEGTDVTVEGIIKSLTPVKTSQAGNKYYNFTLVDGTTAVRAINYDPTMFDTIQAQHLAKSPVKISSVAVKRQHNSDSHQIVVGKRSKITTSSSHIDDNIPPFDEAMFMKAKDVQDYIDKAINVKVKVVKLGDMEEVNKDGQVLRKRNVLVADNSGVLTIVLWEKSVNDLILGCSYTIVGARVKKYFDSIYISLASTTLLLVTEDIGDVKDITVPHVEPDCKSTSRAITGNIIGCKDVQVYDACLFCKNRLVCPSLTEITACTSCSAYVKIVQCQKDMCCKLLVQDKAAPQKHHELTAFLKHLSPLISSTDLNPELIVQDILKEEVMVTIEFDVSSSVITRLTVL